MTTAPLPTIAEIQAAVCLVFNVRMFDMISHRRARVVTEPRQVAMYLAKRLTHLSLPQIGRHFGHRDHTTVMHAVRKIAALSEDDPELGRRIENLERALTTE